MWIDGSVNLARENDFMKFPDILHLLVPWVKDLSARGPLDVANCKAVDDGMLR